MVRSLVLAALLAVAAAGCTGDGDEAAVPVPSVGTTPGPTTPGVSPAPSVAVLSVPQSCDDVIPFTEVVRIVAVPLQGTTNRVYADDFPAESGRTARLTCQYGVRSAANGGDAPPPQVEIAVTGRVVRSAATRAAVTRALAAKYDTKGSQKWVSGFAEPEREANTLELTPG